MADIIDTQLRNLGYNVKRDQRDISDWESIDIFMKTIRNVDYAVPVLSASYMKEAGCMYEISRLVKNEDYRKNTFPVVITWQTSNDRPYTVFDPAYKAVIIKYWEDEAKKIHLLSESLDIDDRSELAASVKRYKRFAGDISEFLSFIADIKDRTVTSDTGVITKITKKQREEVAKAIEAINKRIKLSISQH